jgi:hypothetical protein
MIQPHQDDDARLLAGNILLEEYLQRPQEGRKLSPAAAGRSSAHGHCHRVCSHGVVEVTLKLVPELAVETIDTSRCGWPAVFGGADTIDASSAMASCCPGCRGAGDGW